MPVNQFLTYHMQDCIDIIYKEIKEKTFDSHKFIQHFSKKFEAEYVDFLCQYTTNRFKTVNAEIALFMTNHKEALGIIDLGKVYSQNVFGDSTQIENWEKVN
jgi:hypothetical protein